MYMYTAGYILGYTPNQETKHYETSDTHTVLMYLLLNSLGSMSKYGLRKSMWAYVLMNFLVD